MKTIRYNLSITSDMMKKLDEVMKNQGFTNRSEFIRHLILKEYNAAAQNPLSVKDVATLLDILNRHKAGNPGHNKKA
jgi:metal-responsive CopG/Arc/MetJ family transcriptional regulator